MYRIGKEELNELAKVIEARSMFKINSGTQECLKVETKLSKLFDCKYPIFMSSGHAALVSALTAMGIGPGDQVIVPAYTYIATAMAVIAVGAIPVIAEIDETLTIDPADVEAKITPATKAIIPVHIQGFPCNMDAIMAIAEKYGIKVLEDACQADGGAYHGKRLGTIGDAGALSFNYYKIVSCGEGGALLTSNKDLFGKALIYHDSNAIAYFGDQLSGVDTQVFCGSEYRANELCAAVMNIQLDRMDGILADLRKNKKYMMDQLADVCKFIPSNDIEGDCGNMLAIQCDTIEDAVAFTQHMGGRPINTGKHVYKNWDSVMQKRGALHPLMDPFKMAANQGIVPDYHENMCPKTLENLSKVVYIDVKIDDTQEQIDQKIAQIRAILQG